MTAVRPSTCTAVTVNVRPHSPRSSGRGRPVTRTRSPSRNPATPGPDRGHRPAPVSSTRQDDRTAATTTPDSTTAPGWLSPTVDGAAEGGAADRGGDNRGGNEPKVGCSPAKGRRWAARLSRPQHRNRDRESSSTPGDGIEPAAGGGSVPAAHPVTAPASVPAATTSTTQASRPRGQPDHGFTPVRRPVPRCRFPPGGPARRRPQVPDSGSPAREPPGHPIGARRSRTRLWLPKHDKGPILAVYPWLAVSGLRVMSVPFWLAAAR